MIFQPRTVIPKNGVFRLPAVVYASGPACLDKPVLREFFSSFSCASSSLTLEENERTELVCGPVLPLPVGENEYTLRVTEEGFALAARDEGGLRHGFMTLLDAIECDEAGAFLPCTEIFDRPRLSAVMLHLCIFPETKLFTLRRMIRLCAFLRMTHLIVEFWGMFRYECEPMLSWEQAFTREELAPLIREAADLGLELVPMFNHLGHAAQARLWYGKHVTLDRDPSKWNWFEKDGWAWNLRNPDTVGLLSRVRAELCGVFPGAYFHIGCDEAYSYTAAPEKAALMCEHINRTAEDLAAMGRKTIMWADMLLPRDPFPDDANTYEFNIESTALADAIRARLDRRVILADWQYHAKKVPVRSSLTFRDEGFATMLCPFLEPENVRACVDTAAENGLAGVIHTTWHELGEKFPFVVYGALYSLQEHTEPTAAVHASHAAYLLRKLAPSGGDYALSGWREAQL